MYIALGIYFEIKSVHQTNKYYRHMSFCTNELLYIGVEVTVDIANPWNINQGILCRKYQTGYIISDCDIPS